jgi:hypothetical protein
MAAIKWLLDQGAEINKVLLSEFRGFCGHVLNISDIAAEEEQTLPLWLFAEESDHDTEDPDNSSHLGSNTADLQGRISEKLAWRLSRLGIIVNQDAIRTEGSIESMESLPASDFGSKLGDGLPEIASQKGGNMYQRVMFGFLTKLILRRHGNERRCYNLVSTFIYLDFDVASETQVWAVGAIIQA